jgi:hypothetical protein
MEANVMNTITERDILVPEAVTANVSTFSTGCPVPRRSFRRERQPHPEYLISENAITMSDRPSASVISPIWLGRVKQRIKDMAALPRDWDSYGADPVDSRIPEIASALVEWFAVDNVPPPDVFATSEGGVQIEWHIRRVNVEIHISASEGTAIYFHDLNGSEPWSRPASSDDLRTVRRRLLTPA